MSMVVHLSKKGLVFCPPRQPCTSIAYARCRLKPFFVAEQTGFIMIINVLPMFLKFRYTSVIDYEYPIRLRVFFLKLLARVSVYSNSCHIKIEINSRCMRFKTLETDHVSDHRTVLLNKNF